MIPKTTAAKFGEIYRRGRWRVGDGPVSGEGSDPKWAHHYVEFVQEQIKRIEPGSVLDVGHGDWSIWPERFFDQIRYCGVDVVEELVESVAEVHSGPNVAFSVLDAVSEPLPDADLVMCKDVLQHLSSEDRERLLQKIAQFPAAIICNDLWVPPAVKKVLKFSPRFFTLIWLMLSASPFRGLFGRPDEKTFTGGYSALDLEHGSTRFKDHGILISKRRIYISDSRPRPKAIYFLTRTNRGFEKKENRRSNRPSTSLDRHS